MKQFYKIGEISKLYNIGPDSLRYYEKLGLLTPCRGTNDYRLYTLNDLWRLNVIRDLRKLGFPMEKIQAYMESRNIDNTHTLLEEELSVIEDRILELKELHENVTERLHTLEEAVSQPLDIVQQKEFPVRRCHMIHHPFHTDEEMDMLIKQLLNKDKKNLYIIGNNRIGSLLPLDQASSGQYQNYEGAFIIDAKGSSVFDAGTYLSVCYHGDSHQHQTYYPLLVDYASTHRLRFDGPILELLWIDIHQSADVSEHITELQVKVCRETKVL